MLPTTREWVLKAEGDYDVVLLLLRSRKRGRHDPTCFHAQQCVEKYLKGRLTEAAIPFAKTHDLDELLNLALPVERRWTAFSGQFGVMSLYAVLPRYPGMTVSVADARTAVATCRRFRTLARQSLGLK